MLKLFRRSGAQDKAKTEHAVEKSRRTFFRRVSGVFRRSRIDDALWDELEELLITADVGVATTFKLLDRLREQVRAQGVSDPEEALGLLKDEMARILEFEDAESALESDEAPLVILMVGVNGAGKTTSIAKLAGLYQREGKTVVMGAADTFRAAAIEQLQAWGDRLSVDGVAHRQGADPGAVAYDALQAARARNADAVIIDTAGRLHNKSNLMQELAKVRRVLSRQGAGAQRALLTIDATTGQNGLAQARAFMDAVECEGVLLSKLDSSSKGGIVFAIADELGLPTLFIGTGERADDIAAFDARQYVDELFARGDGA